MFAARGRSLRLRMALWSTMTLAVLFAIYAACVFVFLRESLLVEFDHELRDHLMFEAQMLERTETGIRIGGAARESETREGLPLWVRVRNLDGVLLDARPRTGPPAGVRWASGRYAVGDRTVVVEVAKSEDPMRRRLWQLFVVMGTLSPLALTGAGVAGFVLAGRALAPVARMAARAQVITAERLHERLPIENPADELGQLATVFNDTLARLERSFETLRRFTADASHELRTPLTAMRSVGEVALHEARDASTYREVIGSMLEEGNRLTRLVDCLLVLTRGDGGDVPLRRESVSLAELVRDVAGQFGVLAEEKQQILAVEADGPVEVWADPLVLRRAVINLIDNAINYTPNGGHVFVRAFENQLQSVLEVVDTGPGIPEAHRERIFDRFYRIDGARSRNRGGLGLGLSIARWAAEANGGQVDLFHSSESGSTFRIVLANPGRVC